MSKVAELIRPVLSYFRNALVRLGARISPKRAWDRGLSVLRTARVTPADRILHLTSARIASVMSVVCMAGAVGLVAAAGCGLTGVSRAPVTTPAKSEHTLRIVSLNLAHGRGRAPNQALVQSDVISQNLDTTADYLEALEADVVGLQEVDKNCNWSGNHDQASSIAETAGFDDYRVGVNNRNAGWYQLVYGNAILSEYPIRDWQNHPFSESSSIGGKGFLVADIEVNDRVITFCVVHLAPVGWEVRERQVERIISALEDEENPLVVMGDFNCEVGEDSVLEEMCSSLGLETQREGRGTGDTFDFIRGRRIDYIFSSASLDPVAYRVGKAQLSDHQPVICDLHIEPAR